MTDCRVCLLPHDPAIHAATLDIHAYLRAEVLRKIEPVQQGKPHGPAQPFMDKRLIGHVPARNNPVKQAECGHGRHFAKGMCKKCWYREYMRDKRAKRKGAPPAASGSIPRRVKGAPCGSKQLEVRP